MSHDKVKSAALKSGMFYRHSTNSFFFRACRLIFGESVKKIPLAILHSTLSFFLFAYVFSVFFLIFSIPEVWGATRELTYDKFYRLNNPIYRRDSGDWLGMSLDTTPSQSSAFDLFFSGDVRLYFQDNNSINYSVQEFYLDYKFEETSIVFGRKILDWNLNEKYWSLGYLNGLQSFTLLSTEEEGVTGLIFKKRIGAFEFDILGSYLFIPQVNPSIEIKDGDVTSRSEWVRLPPKRTIKDGINIPIYYKMADYQIEKIIFNKSLGANLKYYWNKDRGGISAFAIYKPENRLRINASGYYDVNLNRAEVLADPTVSHHAYYGLQVFHAFGDVRARGGLSYVDPNTRIGKDLLINISNARKTFESTNFNIKPRYDKEAYAHMSLNLDRENYKLTLNYIHLITDNVRGSDDFYSDAVKWMSTFGGGISFILSENFSADIDLKYDVRRKDNILKNEIRYNYKKEIKIALGLEILKAPDSNSYWSYYRTADTLYSTVGFIF